MLDRLEQLANEFADIERLLGDPSVLSDNSRLVSLSRRHKELEPIVARAAELRAAHDDLSAAREMLGGSTGEDREMLDGEIADAERRIPELEAALRVLMLPKDPNDDRGVIVEIRGAEGGEEANLFARDLFEMYRAYASGQGWSFEVMSSSVSDLGGFAEVSFVVRGDGVWTRLQHEAGPHRVQRAGHRIPGPGAHLLSNGHRPARSRRGRRAHRSGGPRHRCVPVLGPRGTIGEHHGLGRADHSPSVGHRRVHAG